MASIRFISSRKCWQVRWHVTTDKGVFSGSKTFKDKGQATEHMAAVEKEERELKVPGGPVTESTERVDMVAAQFLVSNKRRWTSRTAGHYTDVLNAFVQSLPLEIEDIRDVQGQHILDYFGTKAGVVNGTLNRHLTPIKTFAKWVANKYAVPNFAASVTMLKEPKPSPRVVTQAELDVLLNVLEGETRDIVQLIANTGLRASEFTSLTTANIITTPKGSMLKVYGKGNKLRHIPLNETGREILERYTTKPEGETIFNFSKIKYKQPRKALYLLCANAGKLAKIPTFGPHALRHYFATELFRRGASLKHVSVILGHASLRVTEMIYLHLIPDDFAGITDLLDSK